MPRTLSVAMSSYLSGAMLALCNCVKITRLDGQVFGFTSLDADLVFDGVTYEAQTSVDASELSGQEGSGVDNLDIIGLLTSNRITDTDIRAGLWDGAKVELFLVNFEDTTMGRIPLLVGNLGNFSFDGARYQVEIRSLSQRLAQQIVDLTSPICRVRALFDAKCMPKGYNENGVPVQENTLTPAGFRFNAPVESVQSLFVVTFGGPTTPTGGETKVTGYYSYGRVRFTTGLNANIEREVKSHALSASKAQMTLQEPFPFTVGVGDTALIEAGCDRKFATCQTKFLNTLNFQGEPHLPGNDAVLTRGRK